MTIRAPGWGLYTFEALTIVDLPPDDRHELYRLPPAQSLRFG